MKLKELKKLSALSVLGVKANSNANMQDKHSALTPNERSEVVTPFNSFNSLKKMNMSTNIETAEVPIVVNVANTKVFMVRYTEKDGTPYVNIFTGNTEGVEMPEAALVPLLSSLQSVNGSL